ncbi:MAG: hypothetical protein KA190_19960 [Kofleriaceae bacterium]|nr:hypothetical protein [Kofleriaceae bacterium]
MADNGIMDVIPHASVEEYFHEVVRDALSTARVSAASSTEWYLVGLLGEFTRGRISDEPLGIKLAEAGSDPGQRVKTLKEVGDTSLYVAGFFAESLGRKLVDVDYYVGLGSSAYHELASRLGGSITDVYRDLAERFPAFVEVLGEIRRSADFATPDVIKLYQQWLHTREAWIEKKLRAMGMIVDPGRSEH